MTSFQGYSAKGPNEETGQATKGEYKERNKLPKQC